MSPILAVNVLPNGASFSQRLGAWLYDFIILLAIEILAAGLFIALLAFAMQIGFSIEGYQDVGDYLGRHPFLSPFFSLYLFCVGMAFYAYFWSHSTGQTIGMKTWKIKVVNHTGGRITFTQALIRAATAGFGLGNALVLFDEKNRAFQDYMSDTQLIKTR